MRLFQIVLLIAFVCMLTVGLMMLQSDHRDPGPEAQTRRLVQNLIAIAVEYEVRTGKVPPGHHASPNLSMSAFLAAINQVPFTRKMVHNLGADLITFNEAGEVIGVNDAWGRSLWFMPFNDQQTDRLPWRGTPAAPRPFVMSAGADGKWGTYRGVQHDEDAIDNIKSFSD